MIVDDEIDTLIAENLRELSQEFSDKLIELVGQPQHYCVVVKRGSNFKISSNMAREELSLALVDAIRTAIAGNMISHSACDDENEHF